MRTETHSWIEDAEQVKVKIEKSNIGKDRLWMGVGGVANHTVWFMDEKYLQMFIDNLLRAQLKYIMDTKGGSDGQQVPL